VKHNKYKEALDMFTNALNLNVETKKNSIYYSNRALVHASMENIGLALEDSNKAIEIDPDYLKGYYRRASANLLLCHWDDAIADLEFLGKKLPSEQGALSQKVKEASSRKRKSYSESQYRLKTQELLARKRVQYIPA